MKCWDIVGDEVCVVVHKFHHNTTLPKEITSSFIALIPKNKHPQGLSKYRHISLITNIHKIISKILAQCIKIVLPSLISSCQTTFLLGLQILGEALVINEFVDRVKREKSRFFIFKIKFQKAYGYVNFVRIHALSNGL